ncbi:MAG: branched-chain amino acid ABC transporter permease [Burkholderiales bacterium]|nr:MAG: branched-chain amino acid ABC transporter permease [Burkholderiales bacterium]
MSTRVRDAELLFAAGVLATLALLPAVAPAWQLSEYSRYFSYMLLAASLAWVWGHCGMLCLGQAVFFGIGAYGMSVVTLGKLPFAPTLVSSWAGLALGVGVATLLAWLLGWLFFSARGLGGAFFGIVTLAVAFIVERIAINWNFLGGLNGLMNVPALRVGWNGGEELVDETIVYYAMLGVLAAVGALLIGTVRSPWGRVLLAIRNHELRARALGVNIAREKTRAFALGAAVAALAGALFVTQFNFASPPLIGFALSAEALIWVAVGGRASIVAAALGALMVRLAEAWLSDWFGDDWLLALGVAFVLVVVGMPRGVVGELIARVGGRKSFSAAAAPRAGRAG